MPSAHAILWFLAALLALWGFSLIIRGVVGERSRVSRACPSCRKPLADSALLCAACGYECRSAREARARRRNWILALVGAGVECAAAVAGYTGGVVYQWTHTDPDVFADFTAWNSIAAAMGAFTVSLLVWAVRGDRSRGRRRCRRCWYDMTGSTGLRCPECGHAHGHARNLYRPRRRWRLAIGSTAGLVVAAALAEWPRYQQGGATALVPTTVLIAGLGWLPDSLITENSAGADEWTLRWRARHNRIWGWQAAWLKARVGSIIVNGGDIRSISRATRFVECRGEFVKPLVLAAARGICSSDTEEQQYALDALSWADEAIGAMPDGQKAELGRALNDLVPGLRAHLDDPVSAVVLTSAELLSWRPDQVEWVARELVAQAQTAGQRHLFGLALTLAHLVAVTGGAAAREELEACFVHPKPEVRRFAVIALGGRAAVEPTLREQLVGLLGDEDAYVARLAARELTRWSVPGAVNDVIRHARIRVDRGMDGADILEAVRSGPSELQPVVPELIGLLMSPDAGMRCATARCLEMAADRGVDISPAVPLLLFMRQSADEEEASSASRTVESWRLWVLSPSSK